MIHHFTVTQSQRRVLEALTATGGSDAQIGQQLGLAVDTIKSHLKNINKAAGTHTRLELAVGVWSGRLTYSSRKAEQ